MVGKSRLVGQASQVIKRSGLTGLELVLMNAAAYEWWLCPVLNANVP